MKLKRQHSDVTQKIKGMIELSEVAPPTKKHERMVKHIKKSYKGDGKLTDDEKSIAYATAWKDYNKDKVSEGVALGKTRSTDTNTKGWKARVSSGKGMTLTKAGGLGKSKPKNMDSIVAKYKEQVKSDRRAAAKERRITEGVKSAIDKVLAARKKRKEAKKHDYGRDAGAEAAQKLRDKDHKKYVNFLPANK